MASLQCSSTGLRSGTVDHSVISLNYGFLFLHQGKMVSHQLALNGQSMNHMGSNVVELLRPEASRHESQFLC